MTVPHRARPVRVPLEGGPEAAEGALLVRGDTRPFALAGEWAGGGALVGSEPLAVAADDDDPFALLDRQPEVDEGGPLGADPPQAVGGGWFGYLGYSLGATLEPVPPAPPRPVPLPRFALAFYDHLLRLDVSGRWWFEALWSDEREGALRERLELLRKRVAAGVRERPVRMGAFAPVAPGGAGHVAVVAECRERIAAGEISQANLCLRLEARWSGEPVDLFARSTRTLEPRHAALVAGPWGAVCSLSPELFLRRRGRWVVSEPINGTAARPDGPETLAASAKDRAVNVMTLRPEVGYADLLRASFPPGSVTGAPKVQAMRMIAELEATAREAYTGAIGYASPVAGLELNVAIRTLEMRGERIWLGAGGGIVADSNPEAEFRECLVKARPVVEAAGGRLADERVPSVRTPPVFALAGGASRPDAGEGVFSTMLVRDGRPVDLAAHVERLGDSVLELYRQGLPDGLEQDVRDAARPHALARLRVLARPGDAAVEVEVHPIDQPSLEPVLLAPAALPGGLGAHKWRDRRLLGELEQRLGAVPLLVDLDGHVLEAAHANVWIREGTTLVTPPLDGRILPGTVRGRLLANPPAGRTAREEPVTLERAAAADELLLSSSLRRLHPAMLAGGRPAPAATTLVRRARPAAPSRTQRPDGAVSPRGSRSRGAGRRR